MITKLIILIALAWLGFRIYKEIQKHKSQVTPKIKTQNMVSCNSCGMHIPEMEALKHDGKYFCSKEHLPGNK
jgi:uncharacterized protein